MPSSTSSTRLTRPALLAPEEPPPYEFLEREPRFPALLVCDHAAARVPTSLRGLGLDARRLGEHIALDIGAAALTRWLSGRLGLPAVLTNYSRLVIDCNRRLDDPSAVVSVSAGVPVPGNRALSPQALQARAETFYWPYHRHLEQTLTALERTVESSVIISLHSFTPALNDVARPWQIGILWDKDPRLSEPLLTALAQRSELCVGDNEPYSGRHPADFTADHHGEAAGRAHVSIEVRQDLLVDPPGVARWGEILAAPLEAALAQASLYRRWQGSGAQSDQPGAD